MLRPGTYYPDQCCSGYCVPVLPEDDDRTAEDGIVHDLRGDQAVRLSELLDLHGSSIPPAPNDQAEVKFASVREALDAVPVGTVFEERHRMVKVANGGWASEASFAESHGYYVPAQSLIPPANPSPTTDPAKRVGSRCFGGEVSSKAHVRNDWIRDEVKIAVIREAGCDRYVRNWRADAMEQVTEHVAVDPSDDTWLRVSEDDARAIYEALADHFGHNGHDTRALRKDYDAERARVDKLISHVTGGAR